MKKLKIFILLLCFMTPLYFIGCENKNKNTLKTPSNLHIEGGTIVFDAIKNADYYTISINDMTFVVDAKNNSDVKIIDNKINYDASKIFIEGESYSVKVKANSKKDNDSKFTKTFSYKYNGDIEKPTNVKINSTILTWDTVENASFYLVKIITPNDKIIFDKDGNIVSEDDASAISRADLTEYSFNTNQFDFGSLLSTAGNYKFYVCAVLSSGDIYLESDYTLKTTYSHYVDLKIPTNGSIYNIENNLHLSTVVDINANAISVWCNGYERTAEINGSDPSITVDHNLLNINLNSFFKSYIENGDINFNNINQYSFKTKAKFMSPNLENSYYIDSDYSDAVIFENKYQLTAPTSVIEYSDSNSCYIANWSHNESELISEYRVYVYTQNEEKEYIVDGNINSMILPEDFVAVAIKAYGAGNIVSSPLSQIATKPEVENEIADINYALSGFTLNWDEVANAMYVVEMNNEHFFLTNNLFEIPTDKINSKNTTLKITALKQGYMPYYFNVEIEYNAKLATPTIGYGQGFASANLYELSFTGVRGSLGYYIYIKSKDAEEFVKINQLYTSTTIDLSQYIISEGEYTDYQVKIQAVADTNSIYSDSNLSNAVSVSHMKVLEIPEFYKINNVNNPIVKQQAGNTTKYLLKFYGVQDASSYEILINYNKLTVNAKNPSYVGVYEVDVSNYLIAANNYEIKIRAIPNPTATNIKASDYNVDNYALTKQLSMVENIKVTENEGIYTLSFDPINNAESYRVRVVKANDSDYVGYLNELGLSNSFIVTQSTDVSNYVKQQGVYYFYVTALAPKQNSFYADSTESTTYGYVSKLESLERPSNIRFTNVSKDSYFLNWDGDNNADYYLVKITNPNNLVYEFKVYSATSANINKYITIQGMYSVDIYSMVNATSESAKHYTSSSATNANEYYIYTNEHDFLRYSIYMYGQNYNFEITNANELKNILWYHYLYDIDLSTGLKVMIKPQVKEGGDIETIKETLVRIATEANDTLVYNFNNDGTWLNYVSQNTTTDNDMFSYISQKLIQAYPEYNILENFTLDHVTGSNIFTLTYNNALNVEKVTDETTVKFTNTNYGNEYNYIDLYSRKSANGVFKIDTREEMLVTTSEQLLQAVQHNRKPKFVGESSTAETVYNNAKLVLSAIITDNMTDLEKVTAIFNWLEYGYDITYYTISNKPYIAGSIETSNIELYGKLQQYYLEGIFLNINMESNGNVIIGSNFATSASYSKAFALLCAIEGIDAVVVNGQYTYYDTTTKTDVTNNHVWNKVYLDTSVDNAGKKWFAVDLTFSDNRIYFNNISKGYGIASHSHFLVTDSFNETNLTLKDLNYVISSDYETSRTCETQYNYYANSSFALTLEDINKTITDFENSETKCSNFEYSKEFNLNENYQLYAKTTGYGKLQAFLLNAMIYAKHSADTNASKKSVFEFSYSWNDNSENFDIQTLKNIFDTTPNQYNLRIKLIADSNGTIYSIKNSESKTTTIIFIVEKTA